MGLLRQGWDFVLRIPLPVFFAGTFLLGWLFLVGINVLLFADPLSPFVVFGYILATLPFFLSTGTLVYRVFTGYFSTRAVRLFNGILPSLLGLYFVAMNFWSYRVFLADGENDSPFDQSWFHWPQTAWGFPSPVVHIFDDPLDGYGGRVIDWSSFVVNLWMLSWALFFLVTAEVFGRWLWLKIRKSLFPQKTST
jgi:hypothetical protein